MLSIKLCHRVSVCNLIKAEVLRQDVDIGLARFLSQETIEESKREELSSLLEEVDSLEAEVCQSPTIEHKRDVFMRRV